ncbi:hypothetical protein [Spiroplasma eriocheiris]|uniref:Uncharacterized protein n=1 Tax=Spiroplasma eriocheiris TaxID=315358 RepID=A0A0H3XLK1_9MOLU|nr:hypothetical protein [Spiroplasma eriocheiris]AHF57972.1 hypothetical protein SPE_0852 [Spiroplasma eriocheiris CCTCC M 207170]AKM54414.1 hypothetical protein SERIO_v1c08540 [Spiroplasma eriocheiris]
MKRDIICNSCCKKILSYLKKTGQENTIILNNFDVYKININQDLDETNFDPLIIFKCRKVFFGLFLKENIINNPQDVNNDTRTITLPTSLVVKKFKASNRILRKKRQRFLLANLSNLSLIGDKSHFNLITTLDHKCVPTPKNEVSYYHKTILNQHKHFFKALFLKSNLRFKISFMLIIILIIGLAIGGWQIFISLNPSGSSVDHRINISQDGGDYYKSAATIQNTSSKELLSAVQHISNLNVDLQSAINDKTTILTTRDPLQYDGGYHLMKININANHSEIFKGTTTITMNIKATKFDISQLSGDFSHNNPLHIANIDNTSLLNALKLLPNLNSNLASALLDKEIQIFNIKGAIIPDGFAHRISFTLDANNTNNFKGQLNCQLNLISDKFDISNLKNDYTTSPPVTIRDTSFNSLVYLITSVAGMDDHLISAAQDPNIILTPKSPLPDDGQNHLLKVTIDATNTLTYSEQLTIALKAQAGKMNISSLSQDLTSKPAVSEQDTSSESLLDALQKVQGINQTTLNVLKESNLLIITYSKLPNDGVAHELDITLNAYQTLDYTGIAIIKLMAKTSKTDITNAGGNYTAYGNIISTSVDSSALIKALKQIKQTNPVILSAISDPRVVVSTTSKLPQDDLAHDIEITVNANGSQDYTGTTNILVSMVYPKTDITNWNQDLTSSPVVIEPDVNPKELFDALKKVSGLNPQLKNILTLPGVTITTESKLINDNQPHKINIIIDANNAASYKGKATVTLFIKASTIDLSYFSGNYSQDGTFIIKNTSQDELIKAINADSNINPVLKNAVHENKIIVSTSDKVLATGQGILITITIDGTNTINYFNSANIKLMVMIPKNPLIVNVPAGILSVSNKVDEWGVVAEYSSESPPFAMIDWTKYADNWEDFILQYPIITVNKMVGKIHADDFRIYDQTVTSFGPLAVDRVIPRDGSQNYQKVASFYSAPYPTGCVGADIYIKFWKAGNFIYVQVKSYVIGGGSSFSHKYSTSAIDVSQIKFN